MPYQNHSKRDHSKRDTWIVLGFLLLTIIIITAIILFASSSSDSSEAGDVTEITEATAAPEIAEMPFDVPGFTMLEDAPFGKLNDYLYVSCMGVYSGTFVEDGSDEEVTDVLALVVRNTGEELVEYAEITADCGGETATFELSGLPANAYALVMEKNRRMFDDSVTLSDLFCTHCAEQHNLIFDFDKDFQIYPSDGVINLENISGRDIQSDISIYYKTFEHGLFIGGITYRARITGGIPANQFAQTIQQHYAVDTSAILYMSYAE